MLLAAETLGLCLLFWLFCYLGTGTDEKNLKSFRNYPEEVQKWILKNEKLKDIWKPASPQKVFLSNVLLFSLVLLPLGFSLKQEGFLRNMLSLLVMGQSLNAFDLLMDLLWFRNTKRTRFRGTEEKKEMYRNPENHIRAFLRGIPAFLLVAVLDGLILSWF